MKGPGNIYNRLQLSPWHWSRGHLSISAISQLSRLNTFDFSLVCFIAHSIWNLGYSFLIFLKIEFCMFMPSTKAFLSDIGKIWICIFKWIANGYSKYNIKCTIEQTLPHSLLLFSILNSNFCFTLLFNFIFLIFLLSYFLPSSASTSTNLRLRLVLFLE